MKKSIKFVLTVGIGVFAIIGSVIPFSTFAGKTEKTKNANIYPMTAIVTNIEGKKVTITCQNGNVFQFKNENNEETWINGDICSLIMNDNGTLDIKDDIIIKKRYSGFLSDNEIKQWIK